MEMTPVNFLITLGMEKNSNEKYQKVGTKKPNPLGLYDMHGNVSEWTLDQYIPTAYRKT